MINWKDFLQTDSLMEPTNVQEMSYPCVNSMQLKSHLGRGRLTQMFAFPGLSSQSLFFQWKKNKIKVWYSKDEVVPWFPPFYPGFGKLWVSTVICAIISCQYCTFQSAKWNHKCMGILSTICTEFCSLFPLSSQIGSWTHLKF